MKKYSAKDVNKINNWNKNSILDQINFMEKLYNDF